MIILGIDPGIDRCGWGVIKYENHKTEMIDYGCIQTSKHDHNLKRLEQIHKELTQIVEYYKPQKVGVEELFFSKNAKTAFVVGQARGVILLTLQQANIIPIDITPNQIKQCVTGHGGADKKQIQEMVKLLLKLSEIPKPDDAADGLACAIAVSTWNPSL